MALKTKQIHENISRFKTGKHETVLTLLRERASRYPNDPVMERRREVGGWYNVTAERLMREVDETARGLIGLGLKHGDSIAIMSATRPEWTTLDLAALSIGVIVVPIYESDSVAQIEWIAKDSNARLAVCDTHSRAQLIEHADTPSIKRILSLESGAMRTIHQAALGVTEEELTARQGEIDIDTLATVIYTSGTTGRPKGVMLTHRNFVETIKGIGDTVPHILYSQKTRFLLFLPLAHVFARFVQFALLSGRGVFAHSPDTKNLLTDIETFQPSLLLLVPRVLEKVYNAAEAKAGKGITRKMFRWAATRAIAYSEALETRLGPTIKQRRERDWADKLVLRKVRKALGPNMEYIISGGAPLSPTLGHFFRGAGLTVLEGWGLSETTGPLALADHEEPVMGAVGKVLPGNAIKITEDDEILVKGASIFPGYFNNPQETAEAFDDEGWFHTGDIGHFDRRGNLYITGRKKDIIVTAGGKNVAPSGLEEPLVMHPLISHVIVVGDQKPYIGALITLDQEMLPTWLANHGLEPMDVTQAASHPRVMQSLEKAINRTNRNVSRAESIRKFRIVNAEFTVDNGYLTPSMKLKRANVTRDFAHEIEALYNDNK
ncbi:MAG: AMP-dependent synthetase/ligase [Acidobacteriota bacterium]|nr:AMP-dependent synthetase/ligase [Acidobacteriota bacterium]